MIRLWLSFLILCFSVQAFGQNKVSGTVKSSSDQSPLYDISVSITESGETVKTDRIGYFQFNDVANGDFTLNIDSRNYGRYEERFTVNNEDLDLGEIFLQFDPKSSMAGVITLTSDELASDESSAQSSMGLLQSSQDVFAQAAAYELGAYWFRTRGYDNKYSDVLFNGVRMNKVDNNRVDYGNWGGLNDVTRNPAEVIYGLDPSDYAFGDLAGSMYIDTRPSTQRAGTSFSYSLTNRSYRQRLMLTHNTGLMKNGWGIMVSGSRRWAEEGRIDGTMYDAWGYYLGVEKKFNENHTLNLTAFGAPYRRSTNSPNTQEIYDLMGTGYNAYWGYQNGDKRSERVKKNFEPVTQLTHHWNFGESSKLITTISYQFGKMGASRLNWFNAKNPTPIHYSRFPSYYLGTGKSDADIALLEDKWRSDSSFSQINWEDLYRANLYNVNYGDGSAAYNLVSDVNEDKVLSFSTNLRTQLFEGFTLYSGLNYQNTKSEIYREIDDLLGAQFAWNKDDFADIGLSGEYDENTPDRHVLEGEKFEYNAEYSHEFMEAWISGDWTLNSFNLRLSSKISRTTMEREGFFDHYLYSNSIGKSDQEEFTNYGGKLQLLYQIDGRNFIKLNGGYFTKAPTINEVYPQGRYNNFTLPDLQSAVIKSADINYILRAPRIKARATAFYTKTEDEIETSFGYLNLSFDDSNENLFTAEVLSGVDKQYLGAELAVEGQLSTALTASAVASIGQYTYANNPDLYYFSDDLENGYDYFGKSYLKDYKLASSPQKGYSLGLEYRSPQYWWLGLTGNYLTENYVDVSPSKRTTRFALDDDGFPYEIDDAGNIITQEMLRDVLRQEKFSSEFMLNLNAGKSFRFGEYWAMIGLTVNNLLNNKDYRTGGFEQLRLADYKFETEGNGGQNGKIFGNRYWYDQGTSYFLNLIVRF
ncbi:TonB-dependent receptor [Flavobacteriaceae bacterium Ap0902]|nr:TonB-dependent receptor [Flavobacteriaceae bacterium Ap0902]